MLVIDPIHRISVEEALHVSSSLPKCSSFRNVLEWRTKMFFHAASLHQCMVRWSRSQWTSTSWKVWPFSWWTRTHSWAVERINLSRSERIWTDTLVATNPGHRFIIRCSSIQPCCIIFQFTSSSSHRCFFILLIRIQVILSSIHHPIEVHPKWSNSVQALLDICFRRMKVQFMTNTSMDVKLSDSVWIQNWTSKRKFVKRRTREEVRIETYNWVESSNSILRRINYRKRKRIQV